MFMDTSISLGKTLEPRKALRDKATAGSEASERGSICKLSKLVNVDRDIKFTHRLCTAQESSHFSISLMWKNLMVHRQYIKAPRNVSANLPSFNSSK